MIEGKQNILAWFESTKFPYWSLYHQGKTDSGNWVAKSSEDDSASNRTAYEELQKQLSFIRNGRFTLVAAAKTNITGKGTFRTDIELSMADTLPQQTTAVSGIPPGYVSEDKIGDLVHQKLEEHKSKVELEELKKRCSELEKENRELEKEANDPWTKVIGAVQPYIPHLLGQYTAQVAGIPKPDATCEPVVAEESQDLTDEETERLSKVLSILNHIAGAEWLSLLERLAIKLQKEPSLLGTIKMFI